MKAEFDSVADAYLAQLRESTRATGDDPEYFARYKIMDIRRDRTARRLDCDGHLTCLDFGAGIGTSEAHLRRIFPKARIIAADVSRRSLEINECLHGSEAEYLPLGERGIPLPDNSVDFALAACVFHHIDHGEHVQTLQEILRVLRPGGDLYVFEHNPANPLTVRVVQACPFDENAVLISGSTMSRTLSAAGFEAKGPTYRYFFPAWLGWLRPLEQFLKWAPVGGQYFVRGAKSR